MNGMSIILKKELKRVFGDKKLVFSLFILPAILMIGIYGLMGFLIGNMSSDIDEHKNVVYVINADDTFKTAVKGSDFETKALDGIIFLDEAKFKEQEQDIKDKIQKGDIQIAVFFEKDFGQKFSEYDGVSSSTLPKITAYYNTTENYSTNTFGQVSAVLGIYQSLLLKGKYNLNLEELNACTPEPVDLARPEKANARTIAQLLPYMVIIMLFSGAMTIGVDAIAGEKERGTLASMLLSPVKRNAIAGGKIISLMILSGLSAIVYVASMMIAMPIMSLVGGGSNAMSEGLGGLDLDLIGGLELAATMLSLVFLFVSLIAYLAIRAKDTKSAQTMITPVYIVIMVVGMMTMYMTGNDVPAYRYFIPVYGNAMALKDLCNSELEVMNFLASVGGTIIAGIGFTLDVAKCFDNEKIMFNA